MPFIFDEKIIPDVEEGRRSVRFCMINGRKRATCQIGYTTLSDLAGEDIMTDGECLAQFQMYRSSITTAAARQLKSGAHEGAIIQILRANIA